MTFGVASAEPSPTPSAQISARSMLRRVTKALVIPLRSSVPLWSIPRFAKHTFSRQQLTNVLGKDLIDDAAGSGVHTPDDPALASDMVEENDPIPKYSQAVKALQFAFERPSVPFFVLQILETPPDGLAWFGG